MTREQIKSAALELDPVEREALAEDLLLSIDSSERAQIDNAWLEEIRRRDLAYQQGNTQARSVDEVIDRLKKKAI